MRGIYLRNAWASVALRATKPDELYNLAAQSSVGVSFKQPLETIRVDGLGVLSILETVRNLAPSVRVFLASSSEIFGHAEALCFKTDPGSREKV